LYFPLTSAEADGTMQSDAAEIAAAVKETKTFFKFFHGYFPFFKLI